MSERAQIASLKEEWDRLRAEGTAEDGLQAEDIIREMKRIILSIAEKTVFRKDEKHFSENDLLRAFRSKEEDFSGEKTEWYMFPVFRLYEEYIKLCGNVKLHCPKTGFAAYPSEPEKMKELDGAGLYEELFSSLIFDQCRLFEPDIKPENLHNRLLKTGLLGIYADKNFNPDAAEWIAMTRRLAAFYTDLGEGME